MSIWRRLHGAFGAARIQDCVLCGLSTASVVCAACEADLPRLADPQCPSCALPTATPGTPCGRCQARPPHFDATQAAFAYAFPLDRLVQLFKYQQRLALAAWLAERQAAALRQTANSGVDVLVALPLAPRRLRQRGFNQAHEIARHLARHLKLPLWADACQRVRDTPPQAGLDWAARRANIRGAFSSQEDFSGLRVAVVDDVMTSAATLDEFARLLKRRGAARVENWVVARTLSERHLGQAEDLAGRA